MRVILLLLLACKLPAGAPVALDAVATTVVAAAAEERIAEENSSDAGKPNKSVKVIFVAAPGTSGLTVGAVIAYMPVLWQPSAAERGDVALPRGLRLGVATLVLTEANLRAIRTKSLVSTVDNVNTPATVTRTAQRQQEVEAKRLETAKALEKTALDLQAQQDRGGK